MRLTFYQFFALLCICTSVSAQHAVYDFLHVDVSARAAALQGSFVSMKDDPNVIFYNPASLGTISRPKVSASYLDYLMDVNSGALSYAQHLEGIGNIGAGIHYINYGSFDRTDEFLNKLGSFGAEELALLAGIAGTYDENILVGINAKFIYSSLAEYQSSAIAVDLGVLYEIPSQNMSIGASVLNLGTQSKNYAGVDELLPLDIKVGITKRPEHLPMLLNLVFHRLNEKGDTFFDRFSNFTVGSEIVMSESFRLRLGYNNKQRRDFKMGTSSGLAGFSLGAGIIISDYQFDYAFNSYGKMGGLNRISLSMNL
jgi:hypothetical protein